MRRREFVTLVGASMATWPIEAYAQQSVIPRVGYVSIGAREGTDVSNAGLRQGLADRGYDIGRDLILEERYADGDAERIPALIAELLALHVDVLVTIGTPMTRAAQRATATVPIVCMSGDPVRTKLVASLAHPGGNITGMSLLSGDYSAKWLSLLKEVAPQLHQVAVLQNLDNPGIAAEVERMEQSAPALGLELMTFSARPSEIETSLAALATASVDGLVVTDDPLLEVLMPRLIALTAQKHLPTLYGFSTAPKFGGLMSYSADFFAMWRRTASYVVRILKGAHPADLPVEQATEVTLNINLKTAKALGLSIPQALLATPIQSAAPSSRAFRDRVATPPVSPTLRRRSPASG
jgi:putative tryptophan/tyrosine transport system substrate-binding protein